MLSTVITQDSQQTDGYPFVTGYPMYTDDGIPYLTHPTVALLAKPQVNLHGMQEWVRAFDLGSEAANQPLEAWCLDIDQDELPDGTRLSDGERLIKAGGQLCYASFAGKFTPNDQLPEYLENINRENHGSVTEHANYTFFFGGVTRSWSLEKIRHRHISPSQVSQRYVDGRILRFVARPEYNNDAEELTLFRERCSWYARQYRESAERLRRKGIGIREGMTRTDQRKAVNQVAREVLPNCTETALVMTANARTWRHVINMRGSLHAEPEIRRTTYWLAWCLRQANVAENLFQDIELGISNWEVKVKYAKP